MGDSARGDTPKIYPGDAYLPFRKQMRAVFDNIKMEFFVTEEASPAASFSRIGRSWSCRWGSGNVWRQRMQRHGTYPRSPPIAAVRRVCRGLRRSRRSTEYVSCVGLGRRHARRGALRKPPPAYGGVGCLRSAQ